MTRESVFGHDIVTDRDTCQGKPTFRGARILAADMLEQVAEGLAWEMTRAEWRGAISDEASAEAVNAGEELFLG